MNNTRSRELFSRRTADIVSIIVFVLFLIIFLVVLLHGSQKLPATSTTINSTLQVVKGPHGVSQSTQTTEKTTADVVPSIWVSVLGRDQTVLLIYGAAFLAAYFLAAIVQRIMLGRYAISVGPFSVPEITEEQVKGAADAALSATAVGDRPTEQPEEPPEAGNAAESDPIWVNLSDPNLTLAGWRIDFERELRRIATSLDIPEREQRVIRRLLDRLTGLEIIPYDVAKPLQQLLTYANEGVHGAKVDPGVIDIIRTQGLQLIRYLQSIDPGLMP